MSGIEAKTSTLWDEDDLAGFCAEVMKAAGASRETVAAAVRVMMHASRLGVDSHGVRLLPHYLAAMAGGRLNPNPRPAFVAGFGAIALLDADNAQGAVGGYLGMEKAVDLARRFGLGAVGIRNGSHFGAAGGYALAAAEQGMIGLAFCNSDSFVRLHGGAERLHGTNPIAMAAPVAGARPWLLDMATSAIPYNRIQLYKSLGLALPEGTASTPDGQDTRDPHAADMLAPLGGEFGFKGAGLAGIPEILSAVMTGMKLSFEILPMPGPDMSTPREMGAFVIAIDPAALVGRDAFDAGMRRYLNGLHGSRRAEGAEVMAPGDREWAVADQRRREGIPVDPETSASFAELAVRYRIVLPALLR